MQWSAQKTVFGIKQMWPPREYELQHVQEQQTLRPIAYFQVAAGANLMNQIVAHIVYSCWVHTLLIDKYAQHAQIAIVRAKVVRHCACLSALIRVYALLLN